ncbi:MULTISPECIES: hypothetical protein [Protofrankia]|uniref:Uncharacterized protein n=1 Tax=Protofrankia coriariae TaxID=1562887 RepID=A0ABR5F5B6_9ACTN|nr:MULTISPECIES: hypothetical protein [Protofrankia]KLL11931.1 hypothetical protein FrCorBMG51_07820 [Protofrankia coriariae]ONH36803.1 hypothetical protein BL254_06110 [Protofrankia sp. BMG5.30]
MGVVVATDVRLRRPPEGGVGMGGHAGLGGSVGLGGSATRDHDRWDILATGGSVGVGGSAAGEAVRWS